MKKMEAAKIVMMTTFLIVTACQNNSGSSEPAVSETQFASMAIKSDIPTDPIDCDFNGAIVTDGTNVTAYQNSTVPFGSSCVSEVRNCQAGILSGSYSYNSCSVGAAADCLFNGQTVKHGDAVTAYTSSTVAFGQVCSSVAENRTCNNGVLSGSAQFASCNTDAARSCIFDGKTIAHGDSILAFAESSVSFGQKCTQETRTCNDGTLSGQFTFGSCNVGQPSSCLFNGQTISHGQTVVGFQSSSVLFGEVCQQETRTCDNGVLSGQFAFNSCTVGQAKSCQFDGKTILHNESVIAYASNQVAFGSTCLSESRTCNNGVLSGSNNYSTCSVDLPKSCDFNGVTVQHGGSIVAYPEFTVPFGQKCLSETRTCNDGVLSGSAQYESCAPQNPAPQDKSCLLNGEVIKSGSSVTVYQSAEVKYGEQCVSEVRTCQNGQLAGSFIQKTCTVQAAANCTLNGKTVAHGSSVTVFTSANVPYGSQCQSETRSCNNGVLSGSATAESCVVQPNPNPNPNPNPGQCVNQPLIWEFPDSCKGNCGKGNGYFKSRISRDGGKTWLEIKKNKLPEDLKEIWNYMIDKNGKNSCARPKVTYTASKNKGYVVMPVSSIPDCKVCKFVEVEEEVKKHGQCHKNKKKEVRKVLKFKCGEDKKSKKHHKEDHDDDDDDYSHRHHNHR